MVDGPARVVRDGNEEIVLAVDAEVQLDGNVLADGLDKGIAQRNPRGVSDEEISGRRRRGHLEVAHPERGDRELIAHLGAPGPRTGRAGRVMKEEVEVELAGLGIHIEQRRGPLILLAFVVGEPAAQVGSRRDPEVGEGGGALHPQPAHIRRDHLGINDSGRMLIGAEVAHERAIKSLQGSRLAAVLTMSASVSVGFVISMRPSIGGRIMRVKRS